MKRFLLFVFLAFSIGAQGQMMVSAGGNYKAYTFTPEYKTVLLYAKANSITLPNGFVRLAQNNLMRDLTGTTIFSTRDRIYVGSGDANAESFSYINWKSPGTDNLTKTGTVTYSSLGWTGDGSTGNLNTHFNPSTDGVNFTQNAANITVYISNFGAAADNAIFGVRNAAGTSQITGTPRSSTTANTTLFTLNDNTNSNYASNVMLPGGYIFERTASNTKIADRRTLASSAFTVNSISLTNGEVFLLARNSLSTAATDLRSTATLSYASFGDPTTATEKTIWYNSFVGYHRIVQKPNLYVTSVVSDGVTSKTIYTTSAGEWDSGSVFGSARYDNGTPTDPTDDVELYGGTTDNSSDPIGYSVGAVHYSSAIAATKDPSPIIDILDYPAFDSIIPMYCLRVGSTLYWFFTVRLDGVITHDTYVATSTTSDPLNIGTLTAILSTGVSGHFWHGFKILETHPDTDYWYAMVDNRTSAGASFTKQIWRCLRTNDLTVSANWTVFHGSNIITGPSNVDASANVSPVYGHGWWDGVDFHLVYGRFFDAKKSDSFSLFYTKVTGSTISTFPLGKECLWPTGSLDADPEVNSDAGYTSDPFMVFVTSNTGYIYYAARRGDSGDPYIARNVKQFYLRP